MPHKKTQDAKIIKDFKNYFYGSTAGALVGNTAAAFYLDDNRKDKPLLMIIGEAVGSGLLWTIVEHMRDTWRTVRCQQC